MRDIQKELLIEIKEVSDKQKKLDKFIGTPPFNKLPNIHKALLSVQSDAMTTYVTCLGERLGYINEDREILYNKQK